MNLHSKFLIVFFKILKESIITIDDQSETGLD